MRKTLALMASLGLLVGCSADPAADEGAPKNGAISDAQSFDDSTPAAPGTPEDTLELPLDTAEPVDLTVVTPVIAVAEGDTVPPQTNLHLSASALGFDADTVSGWRWTVVQPVGSASVFLPAANVEAPTFEANVAGTYVFTLHALDAAGQPVPKSGSMVINVVPLSAIHVELLWETPGDDDPTDTGFTGFGESVGSDVDLHFLHPSAGESPPANPPGLDGYFDTRFDCYWQNTNPQWAGVDTATDPRLDRDDTDGAGPENINLDTPEEGAVYRIGVHYWDDWGYGTSYATVRVYLDGELAWQWGGVTLLNDDLWEVAEIAWPSGEVTPLAPEGGAAGDALIRHNFYFGQWP